MNTIGATPTLRIEQQETVHYELNLNPLGVPGSVKRAIEENMYGIGQYPNIYYDKLKTAIATHVGCKEEQIVLRASSSDLIRLFIGMHRPKKVLIPVPCSSEYERAINALGSEMLHFKTEESEDFRVNADALIEVIDKDLSAVLLDNPSNPASQLLTRDEIRKIAEKCKQTGTFLLIDEMYLEFAEGYEDITAVPLTDEFDNLAVLRSVSKFFAVPGLRLAYGISGDKEGLARITQTAPNFNISSLTAAACTSMFYDTGYIERSRSQVHTERSLIYSALATNHDLRLYKPFANFMLIRLPDSGPSAGEICDAMYAQSMILRNCADVHGLDNRYLRFCFMNPRQNDMMVNTLLELVEEKTQKK